MKPTKIVSIIVALLILVAPIAVLKPAFAVTNPVYYTVSFSTTNPAVSSMSIGTVPQNFTVAIWLVNATNVNVPADISSVEVHMNITQLLNANCTPYGFKDMVGQPGGVLQGGGGLLEVLTAGYYLSTNEGGGPIAGPPYTGADEYVVAASIGSNFWQGAQGLVAIMNFTATTQPSISESSVIAAITFNGAALVDGGSNDVPFDAYTAALTLLPATAPSYIIPSTYPAIYFDNSVYYGSAPVGSLFYVNVMIGNNLLTPAGVNPAWDVAGFDIAVTWNNTYMDFVSASIGGFLSQGGATTIGLTGGSFVNGTALSYSGSNGTLEAVFTKINDPTPSSGVDTLLSLTFQVLQIASIPTTTPITFLRNSTIGFYLPDLASWAHPERTGPNEPWNGSITAAELGPPTFATLPSPGSPSNGGFFYVGNDAVYNAPLAGALIDLYDQYPNGYNGIGQNVNSDAFSPQANVTLYTKVTYGGYRVANKLVVFEIFDALGDKITILQSCTNQSGIAVVSFRIPQGSDLLNNTEDPSIFGWWTAVATVDIDGVSYNDTMSWQVGWLIEILSVTALNPPFTIGGQMNFTMTVTVISHQTRSVILSVDVYDSEGYPIGEVAWNTTLSYGTYIFGGPSANATTGTITWDHLTGPTYDSDTDSAITMICPTSARVGVASVYGYALTDWPRNGGIPYCPQKYSTFTLLAP